MRGSDLRRETVALVADDGRVHPAAPTLTIAKRKLLWAYLAGSGAVIVIVTTLAMLNALRDASIEPSRRIRELQ